jgi:hypothetical protein
MKKNNKASKGIFRDEPVRFLTTGTDTGLNRPDRTGPAGLKLVPNACRCRCHLRMMIFYIVTFEKKFFTHSL